jgi:T5SS/PEP-CTERM-associated repeat protein
VIVSGAGATWKSTNLGIGDDGAASLTVTGDGAGTTALDTSDTKIGFGAAPSGTKARVTVDGKGAVWTNSDQIVLGADAGADDNAVVVEAGGVVRTGILSVGDTDSTELSTVTVTGSGSKLEVSKSLYIGYEGHGRLDVSSKATLSVAQSIVIGGGGATGRGVLSVTGEGCTVTTNELYVGKATSKGETSINNNLTVDGDAIVNVKTTLVLTSGNAINVSFAGTVGAITVGSDVTPVDDCVYVEKDGTLDEMAGSQPTSVGTIYGAVFNDGTIDVESMGDLFIDGGLGGSGVATIETKATLAIDGASFGAITFSGAAGELSLGDAIHYTGKIRGFSDGDKLELEDIAYNAGKTKLTYVPNAGNTGGLLSVADGTHTARLTLIGSYKKSDFKLSADPDGGTRVTDVAGDAPAREAFVYARESEASPHAPAPSAWDAASSAIGLLAAEPGSSSVSPGMFGQA